MPVHTDYLKNANVLISPSYLCAIQNTVKRQLLTLISSVASMMKVVRTQHGCSQDAVEMLLPTGITHEAWRECAAAQDS